jgi:hypothetical protein
VIDFERALGESEKGIRVGELEVGKIELLWVWRFYTGNLRRGHVEAVRC